MRTITQNLAGLLKRFKLISVLTVGLLVGGAGGAVVMAAIPDTNGVIHGCYRNPSFLNGGGQVRIIDSTDTCANNETAVNWNSATPGLFLTNLVGADFTDTSLAYRNFNGADLHGSTFNNSSLNGAIFGSSNLSTTTFSNIIVHKTSFAGANLTYATFKDNINIGNTDVTNADFGHSVWDGVTAQRANADALADLEFNGNNFSAAHIENSTFFQTNFSNVDFRNTTILNSAFYGNLSNTNLSALNLDGVAFWGVLIQANLSSVHFINSVVGNANNSNFTGTSFTNTYFAQTDFSNSNFTSTTWSNTTCPDQTNSDNNGNTCIGHLVP
jgi:uncharacterized protein YjbI with pentapeptide repeats